MVLREPDLIGAIEETSDGSLSFEAGEMSTKAEVDTSAETKVTPD
jgi:hypothetical protein